MVKLLMLRLQASADSERLKEIGINIWLACYENAFKGHEDITGDILKVKTKILYSDLTMENLTAVS